MTDHALRGRIGGYTTHSRHDSATITAPARRGFHEKFEREVDPDGRLTDTERRKRARAAMCAHMARLARAPRSKR
jgi:hypothetical protein